MRIIKKTKNGKMVRSSISNDKFNRFLELWGSSHTPEYIKKELKLSQSAYYQCISIAEEFKENYLMSLAEHGIVLKHRQHLIKIEERVRSLNKFIEEQEKKIKNNEEFDKWFYLKAVAEFRTYTEFAVNMLGNATIVKGIEQLFVKLSQKRIDK